jgi:hypothetical protein
MSKTKSRALAAFTLAIIGTTAHAAPVLTLSAKIVKSTISGTNTLITTINSKTYDQAGPVADYQIEVDATATGLPAGQSVGAILFDVTLTPFGFATVTRPPTAHYNYVANNPIWTDDAGDSHQVFSIDGDKGASSTDLVAIATVVDNTVYSENFGSNNDPGDPREFVANGTSTKLGTFVLNASGIGPGFIDTNTSGGVLISFANVQFASLDDTTLVYGPSQNASIISPALLGEPEPASLGLLALGALALLPRRGNT